MNRAGKWAVASAVAAGMTFLASAGPASAAGVRSLVINEVMYGDGHANNHEFVEIRNIADEDWHADLYEVRFQSTSTAGVPGTTVTVLHTFPVGTVIPAGGYYLIVSEPFAAHADHAAVAHNGTFPALYSGAINTNGAVGVFDAAGTRLDSVGWGTSTGTHPMVETAAAPFFTTGQTIERIIVDGQTQDTDDNSADFAVTEEPTPTTTPWVPNIPVVSVTAAPDHPERGQTVHLTALVTPTANPVAAVTVNLSAFGLSPAQPLDNTSGTTWETTFTVPEGQAPGPYTIIVRADDAAGKYGTGGAGLFVYPGAPMTVAAARETTPNTGELVRVRGIVMAAGTGYTYISDPGVNAGIAVDDGNVRDAVEPLAPGQDVTITGRITREDWYSSSDPNKLIYRGEVMLTTATGTTADIVVNSTGNALPTPTTVTLDALATDLSLVGKFVSVAGIVAEKTPSKTAGSTGDNIVLVPALGAASTWVAVSRCATDKAITPYPGLVQKPIPATLDTNFYLPWVAANDTFDCRGVVGITSVGINTTTGLVSPRVLRVRDATDFVLTNGARFFSGAATPNPVERGRTARFRVVAYPVDTASVTLDLSSIGAGIVTLPSDNAGGYAADVTVPASAPLGGTSAPVSVSSGGGTATGSIAFGVSVPTTNPGDINNSGGAPTVEDVVLALRVAGGLTAGSGADVSVTNGDVFPKAAPDSRITLEDAGRILRAVNGLDAL